MSDKAKSSERLIKSFLADMITSCKKTGLYVFGFIFGTRVLIALAKNDSLIARCVPDEGPEIITFVAFSVPCTGIFTKISLNVSVCRNSFCSLNKSIKSLASLYLFVASGHKETSVSFFFKKKIYLQMHLASLGRNQNVQRWELKHLMQQFY